MLSPKIETERLILRRYQESDLDAIYEIITDERLSKYIKFPNLTREEELEYIRKWICEADESKYEKWVIEIKATGEVAGNIDVNTVVKKHNYCNVGYTIRYNYWGNGYAAEALKAVSDHLLNNMNSSSGTSIPASSRASMASHFAASVGSIQLSAESTRVL